MIKTIHRIRLPEASLSLHEHTHISDFLSIDCRGRLQSVNQKPTRILRLRWHIDAVTGKPISHWESGEDPDPIMLHLSKAVITHKPRIKHALLQTQGALP
jgi:hypothetical protein